MKKFKFKIRGNDYQVDILKHERNEITVEVNGTEYKVELEKEVVTSKRPTIVRSAVNTNSNKSQIKKQEVGSASKILAPLPGTIIKVMVAVGDTVKAGDTLLTMEAMKMENNVNTEKAGKIASIKVKEGDTVLQNDVLIEIN